MRQRIGLAVISTAAATLLVACGGATVDSEDVTSQSPTTTTTSEDRDADRDADGQDAERDASASRTSARSTEREITDDGATRVSTPPQGTMPLSKADEDYLDALIDAGIDVEGAEDQLIAAGNAQCDISDLPEERDIITKAVAGQMIAQDRADGNADEVANEIATAGKKAYC